MLREYSPINSSGVQYDEAGNLTRDEDGYTMRYDGDGQLDLVYLDADSNGSYNAGDAVVGEYRYDALGRRIEFKNYYDGSGIYCGSTPCTVTTRYVQDGQNVIAEYNAASTPVRQRYYVHGTSYIDERAVMRDEIPTTAKDYYYLLKDLYTVVGLANKQGHDVERYTYDAYGAVTITALRTGDVDFNGQVNATDRSIIVGAWTGGGNPCQFGPYKDVNADGAINATDRSIVVGQWTGGSPFNVEIPASAIGNPYGFTGRTANAYLDAFGTGTGRKQVLNYRARDYDVEHARFLQRDPAGYSDGASLYEFVASSPIVFTDPTGKWKWKTGRRDPARSRAVLVAEQGDTVMSLVQDQHIGLPLDPEQYRMWLIPEPQQGGPSLPTSKTSRIRANCMFSVPNKIYVHQGANKWYAGGMIAFLDKVGLNRKGKPGTFPWGDPFLSEEMRDLRDDFEARGFLTVLKLDVDKATVLADLADPDLFGWAMGGHASFGVMFATDDGILPADLTFFDQQSKSVQNVLRHRLGIIIHYGCFSYNAGWLQSVAEGGDYYSSKANVYSAWLDWYELHRESPNPQR